MSEDARAQRVAWLRDCFDFVRNEQRTELDLSRRQLTDDDAAVVAEELQHRRNGTLKTLKLNENNIGKKGAEALARALKKKNSTLKTLELNSNNIHNKAAIAIAKALKVNTGLETVSLNCNKIGHDACSVIKKALKANYTLRVLDLSHNIIGDEGAASVADGLKENRGLLELVLDDNGIGEEGGKAIADAVKEYTVLHELRLNYNNLADEGAARFAAALESNSWLQQLFLCGNSISSVGATAIARSLHANATLTVLALWNNRIGAEGVIAIMNALKVNATLSCLALNGNNADAVAATAVGEALQVNSALTEFVLAIGRNSMRAVAGALLVNTTLQVLYLQGNSMGDDEAVAFAEALKVNTRLQILNLENNNVGSAGLAALSDALMFNSTPSLRQLHLQGNIIDDDGVNSLTNIQVSLAMGALDRFFQSLRFKLERGLDTSIAIPYKVTLGSGRANVLALSLQENTTVTELKLPLEEEWTREDIDGNLAPLLQYIKQSATLGQLTYILRKGDTAAENRRFADVDVVRSFLAAVRSREPAIDFTLAVNLRWLNNSRNLRIFEDLMQSDEYPFLTKLVFVDYESEGGDLDGILNRGPPTSALKLVHLSIEVATPCGQWLENWEASAHKSPLRVFSLKVKDLGTLKQFYRTLPVLSHLQELRVDFVGTAAIEIWRNRQSEFLLAVNQNGSLQDVEVLNNGIPQGLPQQMQLYSRRNENMPRRMFEGRAHNPNDSIRATITGDVVPPRLSCYPKLFHQSSQCPASMGPSWMLRGLVALGDAVCTTPTEQTDTSLADR